jgi:hypothetical protein
MHIFKKKLALILFSVFICVITYGFALNHFALTIDNEQNFLNSGVSSDLGRWGNNLIRCRIFGAIIPYYTLLISLLFLSQSAVNMTSLFKIKGMSAFVFCGLFLTFPQMAYQLIFTMQSDSVCIGFWLSTIAIEFFILAFTLENKVKSILLYLLSSLFLMFIISIYQALIFIPITIFVIVFFQNTFTEEFDYKIEFKKTLFFIAVLISSVFFYFISVKILCPDGASTGFMSNYSSGSSNNRFVDFYNLLVDNYRGDLFYGQKTFVLVGIITLFFIVYSFIKKKHIVWRLTSLFFILITPFIISLFITSGGNPPRLYVATGFVFAFLIVKLFEVLKFEKIKIYFSFLICLINIYFITLLFQSSYKVFNHDLKISEKIYSLIVNKYPEYNENLHYVYFFGKLPDDNYNKFRLHNSEIFGGSFFQWDGGSNNRIINFNKFNNIANYKEIDNKESYLKIKDSIVKMSKWPNYESVKLFDDVIVVKLGNEKGAKLAVE